jgi:signal transduction histidine kinase/CheY-like chemotaxis protein
MAEHSRAIQAGATVEATYIEMGQHGDEFVGVLDGARLLGVVSRTAIMTLLSGRYGFPLYARRPVREQILKDALAVPVTVTLADLLDRAFARTGQAFHHDVGLVEADGTYIGMIPMRSLVHLQSRILTERTEVVRAQHLAIEERNRELFRSVAELRQSRGRYEILFENSALGVALLNARSEVGGCNRRFCEILGWPPSATGGGAGTVFSRSLPPVSRDRLLAALCDLESGKSSRIEIELELDGVAERKTICRAYLGWVRETAQVTLLLDDVTEQRRMEHLVAQQEKSAMLDTLVGGIAHELNNKLTPILGYAAALEQRARRPGIDPEIARGLEIVRRASGDAAHIIRQLLHLSRPVSGDRVACDLCAVIREVSDMLRYQLRESNCAMRFDLPPGGVIVSADAGQMKQVLLNLIVNSVYAVRTRAIREVTVRIDRRETVAQLTVSDSGCGMAPAVLARAFDPFFSTKGPTEGTGLGLSVCESIIRAHGGHIRIDSEVDVGTVVGIELPLSSAVPKEEDPGVIIEPDAGNEPLTILIVDDEEFVVNLVQEVLRTYIRCRVESARDGIEALQIIESQNVDLIISDVRMPNLDGLDLFARVAGRWPHLDGRFIFITGDPGGRALDRRLANTGAPVLMKPFKIDHLVGQCRRVLVPPEE